MFTAHDVVDGNGGVRVKHMSALDIARGKHLEIQCADYVKVALHRRTQWLRA